MPNIRIIDFLDGVKGFVSGFIGTGLGRAKSFQHGLLWPKMVKKSMTSGLAELLDAHQRAAKVIGIEGA